MTLIEMLNSLRGPGINAAVGVLLSILLEYLPGWESKAPKLKRPIVLGLCLAVPLLATLVLAQLGQVAASELDTWWLAIMAGATAFSTSQLAHLRKL